MLHPKGTSCTAKQVPWQDKARSTPENGKNRDRRQQRSDAMMQARNRLWRQ